MLVNVVFPLEQRRGTYFWCCAHRNQEREKKSRESLPRIGAEGGGREANVLLDPKVPLQSGSARHVIRIF